MLQANFTQSRLFRQLNKAKAVPLFQDGQDLPLFTRSPDVTRRPPQPQSESQPTGRGFVQLSIFEAVAN